MPSAMKSSGKQEQLHSADFCALFGCHEQDFSPQTRSIIESRDFSYTPQSGIARDCTIRSVVARLIQRDFAVSGPQRIDDWERGWGEILERFKTSGHALESLVPQYVRSSGIIRLNREYVTSTSPTFELDFYTAYRSHLFSTYFASVPSVYEFGCGTAYNLALLGKMFPALSLHGLDWARPAVELVDSIARAHSIDMKGHRFNMFEPDQHLVVEPGAAILTLNSMEQLGAAWEPFLEYILKQEPSLVVHAEPFVELYESDNLLDFLGAAYHTQRNYLTGYLARLDTLHSQGIIRIIKRHRVPVGSLFHEGYSLVVWQKN